MAAARASRRKQSRSEVVTVRLDPKLRYAAELAARKQRRTLSSLVEWAIEDALSRFFIDDQLTALGLANQTWDVDEADRFAALALSNPELLNHDEQVLWKLIREYGWLWMGRYNHLDEWTWRIREQSLRRDELRRLWGLLQKVSAGEAGIESLPDWARKKGDAGKEGEQEEEEPYPEDDIPF